MIKKIEMLKWAAIVVAIILVVLVVLHFAGDRIHIGRGADTRYAAPGVVVGTLGKPKRPKKPNYENAVWLPAGTRIVSEALYAESVADSTKAPQMTKIPAGTLLFKDGWVLNLHSPPPSPSPSPSPSPPPSPSPSPPSPSPPSPSPSPSPSPGCSEKNKCPPTKFCKISSGAKSGKCIPKKTCSGTVTPEDAATYDEGSWNKDKTCIVDVYDLDFGDCTPGSLWNKVCPSGFSNSLTKPIHRAAGKGLCVPSAGKRCSTDTIVGEVVICGPMNQGHKDCHNGYCFIGDKSALCYKKK